MFFEKNRNFVAKYFPYLMPELSASLVETATVALERSKTGLPVARVCRGDRKVYLNSPYDPELEARKWAANQEASSGNLVVCGGGLLYHLKALLETGKYQKVIVYEPSIYILKACLQEIDLEANFGTHDFLLLAGANYDVMMPQLTRFLGVNFLYSETNLQIATLPSYKDLFREELALFQNTVREKIKLVHINVATTNFSKDKWLLNEFMNLHTVNDSPVVRHFMQQFKGVPGVIVAAGPSLGKNVHLLNDIKEKALIICAGSSIRAMLRNGVSPHFLLAIDPGDFNAKVYNDLDLQDISLLYSLNFYHGVVSQFNGRKILLQTDTERFPEMLKNQFDYEFGRIKSGFSVAHCCLDLAVGLGCDPIIMIGQDLAYSGERRYAEGQVDYVQKYYSLSIEKMRSNCFITKDINGEDIVTDNTLDGFRIVFESMIEHFYQGKVRVINCTEGGVPIKGAVNRRLAEVLAEHCREELGVTSLIQRLYERGLKEIRNRKMDVRSFAEKLKTLMERSIFKMEELVDRLQRLRKFNFTTETDFRELDSVLEQISSEYDQALKIKEYHILLKPLQETSLSINKYRTVETSKISSKEEYDERLQKYLLILLETQKALEYIRKCIQDSLATESEPSEPDGLPDDSGQVQQLEIEIRESKDLARAQKLNNIIQMQLRNTKVTVTRSQYLYLLGLLQIRNNHQEQAIATFEEAVSLNKSLYKAYFELFKLYFERHNYAKAVQCLDSCRKSDFKPFYCLKMQLKINYLGKDYVVVNNLLEEYQKGRTSQRLLTIVRIECLSRLGLQMEAAREYQLLTGKIKLSSRLTAWVQNLLQNRGETPYQEKYRANQSYFKERGLVLNDLSIARYKVCRFLRGELIYDSISKRFLPWANYDKACTLKLWLEDTLVIYNTDNPVVFERLELIYNQIDLEPLRKQFQSIPIFIFEHDREHWNLMLQVYDFNVFKEWENVHYFIGVSDDEIKQIYLDEAIPFPSILYANEPEHFRELLLESAHKKDEIYQREIQELLEYYQTNRGGAVQRVLLVTSIADPVGRFYADLIQNYLTGAGYSCRIYGEQPPYYRLTHYANAKIIYEFRPDLVVTIGLIQEELEAFKEIPVPVVSWLYQEKSLRPDLVLQGSKQRLLITGDVRTMDDIMKAGLSPERIIAAVPFPVIASGGGQGRTDDYDIGIIGNLGDLEDVLKNLEIVIGGVLKDQYQISDSEIGSILKNAYFAIYTRQTHELSQIETRFYEQVLAENFSRHNQIIHQTALQFLAGLIKQEFERLFFKLLQARWTIDDLKNKRIGIFGLGWERNEIFKTYFKEGIDFCSEPVRYQQAVLRSKVNLYLGYPLNNNSFLQPDLLHGIAAGGFFLVNELSVKESEAKPVESFAGLLETYRSREEMLTKVKYFVENDELRNKKARQLQEFVLKEYTMERFIDFVFNK